MRAGISLLILTVFFFAGFLSCKTTGRRGQSPQLSANDNKTLDEKIADSPGALHPGNEPQAPVPNDAKVKISILFQEKEASLPSTPVSVEFRIAAGVGNQPWNTEAATFFAEQGQQLKLINDDSVTHRLHTEGRPCEHGVDFAPGTSTVCPLTTLYDAARDPLLYDHNFDTPARFYLKVLPPLKKTLEERCLGCHSGAKPQGALDLLSWPPKSGSANLGAAFQQRLVQTAPAARKMPPGIELNDPEREGLLRWAALGFPRLPDDAVAAPAQRTIRWSLVWNGKSMQTGSIPTVKGVVIEYPKDQTRVVVRLEENLRDSWQLLKEQEVFTSLDSTVLIPVRSPVSSSFPANATIDSIFQFVQDAQIRKVEDFIQALPEDFKRNYVLMHETRSRHIADVQHPRLINFSDSARLLLGFSSHPDDPLRENVEMAEALNDGTWKFREINFRGGGADLSKNDEACKVCHSAQPRPIWGSYPNWPGAFGDEGGKVTAAQFAALAQLPTLASTRDRFAALSFSLRAESTSFYLPKRSYSYPNTVMNVVLGRRVAYQHFKRIAAAADYTKALVYALGAQECPDWSSSSALYARWRQLLTASDMALNKTAGDTILENDRYWNQSAANLDDFIIFFGLMELIRKDSKLAEIFQPVMPLMEGFAQLTTVNKSEVSVDGLLMDFRPHQYAYRRVLGDDAGEKVDTPLGPGVSTQRAAFCSILSSY